MKTLFFASIIASILFLSFILEESWQATEKMFYGYSSFEKLPPTVFDTPSAFEIKIRYTEGPYAITKLTPVFDVSPENAKSYVQINAKPIEGLYHNDVGRIQGTITVDPQIPYKKIFINVYFNGKDAYGNSYKSAWSDSISIDTGKSESTNIAQKCSQTNPGIKYGTPINLEHDIIGGIVVSNCKVEDTNSVVTKIDAESDGQITITIPKKVIYSLSSTDCAEDSDLMILLDNEEVLPAKSIHTKKDNIITVEFSKGVHTIEFVGFTILPDPSPAQYCGVVMGFDSLFLPPKFQIEHGMKAEQVRCNNRLVLVIKSTDAAPACVKPETGKKLLEQGWTKCTGSPVEVRGNPCGPSSSGAISFEPPTISCPNQNMCTISVEGVILKSMPDRHESTYYFFTNDNIGSVKTGATGIPLEINQDKTIPTDLHGKVIKLRGQMFLEPFSKIFVEDLQIVRDLIPALSYNITDYMEIERSDGKTEMVTMNELFQNPAKYYWKQVSVKGLLKERGAVGVPSIECISVNFEESQEFRFEAFRSPYVLEGIVHDNDVAVDARLGIRLESGKEYKFVDWERLPPDLKDKNVVVAGMFQPTVSNSGICKAVLHPAGYMLTTFDKITIVD
ncbi:MAG: hypothetical protein WAO91_08900 [Candidatus Nitrosotenuis sp.]